MVRIATRRARVRARKNGEVCWWEGIEEPFGLGLAHGLGLDALRLNYFMVYRWRGGCFSLGDELGSGSTGCEVIVLVSLFGNANLERILLFLFVNERCYGAQIQTLLNVPLTPVQKALGRLEKGGIVSSRFEGKIRIYELNAGYPLRGELEALLKKAYHLLPVGEKKRYCFIHKPRLKLDEERRRDRGAREELSYFWERLRSVGQLSFYARAQGVEKMGKAEVQVFSPSGQVIVYQEKGLWLRNDLPDTAFHNSFRWSLDLKAGLISLEHLRYGPEKPVFLFHLAPGKANTLESVDSHLCAEDTYLGNVVLHPKGFDFHWRIIGPQKNDELTYSYK